MAIPLLSKPNVEEATSDYPYGNIKDNTGTNNGTPVNKEVYADFHQFFARLLAVGSVTANGLPENNSNGWQYITALQEFIKTFLNVINPNGLITKTIAIGDWNMDADGTKTVAHGMSDHTKIRNVSLIIISDDNKIYPVDAGYGLFADGAGFSGEAGDTGVDATNITVSRIETGIFDNTNFDATSYNRGWITIQYAP
jgi:hypothetical protein